MPITHPLLRKIADRLTIGVPRTVELVTGRSSLAEAIEPIASLPAGRRPTTPMLESLRLAWGNPGFSPSLDLLKHVARRACRINGPVLECGSGLTTILLGLLTQKHGIEVWALEHHPKWHEHLAGVLQEHGLDNVHLSLSPLVDYDDFKWYALPKGELPKHFALVVCDGPPGMTRGGRYGLLPVMGKRLARHCTIIMDDTFRRRERKVIERWSRERRLHVREIGVSRSLSEIRFDGAETLTPAAN
jgi:hypothetical protein